MASAFIRRFLSDPGNGILLNIESVNILDLLPPGSISGIGTGTVLIVGEFEDGPYDTPTQIADITDLTNNWFAGGGIGFTYGGVQGNYPCAVQRFPDQAVLAENWNGNAAMQLNGKQFAELIVVRPNTSVGNVQLTPLAYITGAANFRYTLVANQVLGLDVGAGPQTATFTATAATLTSTAETYASVVGGDTITFGIDASPNFTVTFQSTDTTQSAVLARINQFAGFTFATVASGTTLTFTGLQQGNQGQVRVVATSSGGVLTYMGLSITTTFGTGNVANINQVQPAEVTSVVQAAIANTLVQQDQNGALRISNTLGNAYNYVLVTTATTATNLGFVAGQIGTPVGVAALVSTAGTYTTATSGTFVMSYDAVNPFTVTIGSAQSLAQVVTAINTAAGATIAYADSTVRIALVGKAPGGNINIISASAGAVLSQLGLAVGLTNGVALPQGSIPAGTVVQTANAGNVFVTAQSVVFGSAGSPLASTVGGVSQPTGVSIGGVPVSTTGPWTVPVRHANDNTQGVAATAGTITSIPTSPLQFSLSCTNLQATSSALTDSAIDAQYVTALATTTQINSIAKTANIVYSARQSNSVRNALLNNALTASANGCYGRVACVRPPLNTLESVALSFAGAPGVGATANQRVIYCYPQASTFVPAIALRGSAGNLSTWLAGNNASQPFTPTGNVDVGADGFMASILSQLPPEENPGQETTFAGGIVGIESGANVQGFQINDYILFKAAGIAGLRIDQDTGVAIFQSGVTSVNPLVYPQLVRISRRRMADYIQDSLARIAVGFSKRLSTNARRKALVAEIKSFLEQLLNRSNPASARIGGYNIDSVSGNTPTTLGLGMFRLTISVQTLSSLDSIVLATIIGEQVSVQEQLPQAA
jgi:hypothetical protein